MYTTIKDVYEDYTDCMQAAGVTGDDLLTLEQVHEVVRELGGRYERLDPARTQATLVARTCEQLAEVFPVPDVVCAYCGRSIPAEDEELVPAVDDDDEWQRLAVDHDPDCEWIVSRSFRRA